MLGALREGEQPGMADVPGREQLHCRIEQALRDCPVPVLRGDARGPKKRDCPSWRRNSIRAGGRRALRRAHARVRLHRVRTLFASPENCSGSGIPRNVPNATGKSRSASCRSSSASGRTRTPAVSRTSVSPIHEQAIHHRHARTATREGRCLMPPARHCSCLSWRGFPRKCCRVSSGRTASLERWRRPGLGPGHGAGCARPAVPGQEGVPGGRWRFSSRSGPTAIGWRR